MATKFEVKRSICKTVGGQNYWVAFVEFESATVNHCKIFRNENGIKIVEPRIKHDDLDREVTYTKVIRFLDVDAVEAQAKDLLEEKDYVCANLTGSCRVRCDVRETSSGYKLFTYKYPPRIISTPYGDTIRDGDDFVTINVDSNDLIAAIINTATPYTI